MIHHYDDKGILFKDHLISRNLALFVVFGTRFQIKSRRLKLFQLLRITIYTKFIHFSVVNFNRTKFKKYISLNFGTYVPNIFNNISLFTEASNILEVL